ncbi:ParB/RepB/Spo0J family partition protein [Streptomyces sp. AC627_RSS907]|uniref:ParB/RepB/Spo0J family partition protein n=1 Tax=Streptomyces sp. AC627_RSS907 TaxID=2823684 RepID=UPI001C23B3CD|nr:ParB/RepB/Spo0J family partition protein [Streptomyces sp. AC627_RSS907]
MSKADQLGAGRFGGGSRPVSARRAAIGAATGVPTEGVAPPTRLPISRINPNPDNPRTSLGDLTELAGSLREHGQKQAITVMNRDAYLKANPEREQSLEPHTTHVVVDGSSRLAAAREAGLTHLNVMVDDTQGSDSTAILESALVANIHRSDLAPLDEARALERLLVIHGSQVKLAKRLHKSQGWVSQRLALLQLTPELQARVGGEPIELLRTVAKLPHERQEAALDELKAERDRKAAERAAAPPPQVAPEQPAQVAVASSDTAPEPVHDRTPPARPASASVPAREEAVVGEGSGGLPAIQGDVSPASGERVLKERSPAQPPAERVETVPEPRSDSALSDSALPDSTLSDGPLPTSKSPAEVSATEPRRLPYDDGAFIAMHLIRKMSVAEFDRMVGILVKHQRERTMPPHEQSR